MGGSGSKAISTEQMAAAKTFIQSENAAHQVTIWSKSYCPYCTSTKNLFKQIGNLDMVVHEMDDPEKAHYQDILQELTGQRTVPNVFVNGKHLGGNDNTQAAYKSGKLQQMLKTK